MAPLVDVAGNIYMACAAWNASGTVMQDASSCIFAQQPHALVALRADDSNSTLQLVVDCYLDPDTGGDILTLYTVSVASGSDAGVSTLIGTVESSQCTPLMSSLTSTFDDTAQVLYLSSPASDVGVATVAMNSTGVAWSSADPFVSIVVTQVTDTLVAASGLLAAIQSLDPATGVVLQSLPLSGGVPTGMCVVSEDPVMQQSYLLATSGGTAALVMVSSAGVLSIVWEVSLPSAGCSGFTGTPSVYNNATAMVATSNTGLGLGALHMLSIADGAVVWTWTPPYVSPTPFTCNDGDIINHVITDASGRIFVAAAFTSIPGTFLPVYILDASGDVTGQLLVPMAEGEDIQGLALAPSGALVALSGGELCSFAGASPSPSASSSPSPSSSASSSTSASPSASVTSSTSSSSSPSVSASGSFTPTSSPSPSVSGSAPASSTPSPAAVPSAPSALLPPAAQVSIIVACGAATGALFAALLVGASIFVLRRRAAAIAALSYQQFQDAPDEERGHRGAGPSGPAAPAVQPALRTQGEAELTPLLLTAQQSSLQRGASGTSAGRRAASGSRGREARTRPTVGVPAPPAAVTSALVVVDDEVQ